MSTYFYDLAEPWSSIRVEKGPVHDRLLIWVDGKKSGELVFRVEDEGALTAAIMCFSDQNRAVAHRTGRGAGKTGLHLNQKNRRPQVISEYGEIIDLEDLIASCDEVEY